MPHHPSGEAGPLTVRDVGDAIHKRLDEHPQHVAVYIDYPERRILLPVSWKQQDLEVMAGTRAPELAGIEAFLFVHERDYLREPEERGRRQPHQGSTGILFGTLERFMYCGAEQPDIRKFQIVGMAAFEAYKTGNGTDSTVVPLELPPRQGQDDSFKFDAAYGVSLVRRAKINPFPGVRWLLSPQWIDSPLPEEGKGRSR